MVWNRRVQYSRVLWTLQWAFVLRKIPTNSVI